MHLRSDLNTEHKNNDSEIQFLTCGHPTVLGFVATRESSQLLQESSMRSFLGGCKRYRAVSALENGVFILAHTWRSRWSLPDEEDSRSCNGLDDTKNQDLHGLGLALWGGRARAGGFSQLASVHLSEVKPLEPKHYRSDS